MPVRILILGAGFGGLELSTRLAEELGDQVRVTLIDQSDAFVFGFSKLDVMFGRLRLDDVRLHYRDIARPHVEFRQETVVSIDATSKRVVTGQGHPRSGHPRDRSGSRSRRGRHPRVVGVRPRVLLARGRRPTHGFLAGFESGNIVIAVLGGFFNCPPAPYETAFMLHDQLTKRGVRDACTISLVTPMPKPIPISDEVSNAILALCDERGVQHSHSSRVERLDPAQHVAWLRDGRNLHSICFSPFLSTEPRRWWWTLGSPMTDG